MKDVLHAFAYGCCIGCIITVMLFFSFDLLNTKDSVFQEITEHPERFDITYEVERNAWTGDTITCTRKFKYHKK